MKKKLLCIMMAAAMASSVTACGSKSADSPATTAETTQADTKTEETTKEETTQAETEEETQASDSKFQTGSWDGLVFTNPWLGLTITFPEDSYVLTEDEVSEILGVGQDILVNNGNYTDMQMKLADVTTIYDFMVALPDGQSNVQLAYENTKLTAMGMKITEEDYLDILAEQLTAVTDMQYEMGEKSTAKLGGETFVKMSASVMGGIMYQDYYCRLSDGYMAVMTVSYIPECQEAIDELIEGITAAK